MLWVDKVRVCFSLLQSFSTLVCMRKVIRVRCLLSRENELAFPATFGLTACTHARDEIMRARTRRRSRAPAFTQSQHRPKTLDKLVLHAELGQQLKELVGGGNGGSCPHLLFYGPPGAGKKTLLLATLREIFGPGVEKLKVESKPWKIERPEKTMEVELTTVSSNYHVELTPGDVGNNDRFVVQMIIKDMAKSRPLDVTGQKSFKGAMPSRLQTYMCQSFRDSIFSCCQLVESLS